MLNDKIEQVINVAVILIFVAKSQNNLSHLKQKIDFLKLGTY